MVSRSRPPLLPPGGHSNPRVGVYKTKTATPCTREQNPPRFGSDPDLLSIHLLPNRAVSVSVRRQGLVKAPVSRNGQTSATMAVASLEKPRLAEGLGGGTSLNFTYICACAAKGKTTFEEEDEARERETDRAIEMKEGGQGERDGSKTT
ncbi:Gud1p [Anopheles sinensis]|uniref:Gud1p n=1 Tax=Anopheles sinensis TaxID=74873 RepID=A0A084VLN0_ANOSI|nr:Gud1p [Anopheles sinensis]